MSSHMFIWVPYGPSAGLSVHGKGQHLGTVLRPHEVFWPACVQAQKFHTRGWGVLGHAWSC